VGETYGFPHLPPSLTQLHMSRSWPPGK
jgi:hypothetical protein